MNKPIVMGVDIGGSHITAALVDLEARKVLKDSWTRERVDSHESANHIIKVWSEVIKETLLTFKGEVVKIGIGMPGPFNYEKGICFIEDQDKYDSLYGLNIKNLLAEALGIFPDDIRFINDAACFLKGEAFGGAAKRFQKVIGLTLGTGLGSSVCTNDIAVDADLWKDPFKGSIAEDYLSTRWFIKRYYELTGKTVANVKELASKVHSNEDIQRVFEEFGSNLGLFLHRFIGLERPEAIVLGGNISHSFALFEKSLKESISADFRHIPIFKAVLGEEGALLGASSVWYTPSYCQQQS